MTKELAEYNALQILRFERWLGLDIEERLKRFVLMRCKPWVMNALCDVYLMHIAVGIAFLGYGYTYVLLSFIA